MNHRSRNRLCKRIWNSVDKYYTKHAEFILSIELYNRNSEYLGTIEDGNIEATALDSNMIDKMCPIEVMDSVREAPLFAGEALYSVGGRHDMGGRGRRYLRLFAANDRGS